MERAIADREGRATRREAARRFTRWWHGPDGVGPLRAAIDRVSADVEAGAEGILAAARPWLEDIGWIDRAIARLAAEMSADPLFEPPLRQVSHEAQSGLRLLTHEALTLSLICLPLDRVAERKRAALGSRSIVFTGRSSLIRVVRAADAALQLWESDAEQPCLSADGARRCRRAGAIALRDGLILDFDGARQSWTQVRARGDVVLLQAVARRGGVPLMLEYDAEDGRFVGATMTDGAAARMQLFAALLRRMGRTDAAPAIADAVIDAPFHLRWQLMRELVALDAAAARPLLGRLARADPHPEVRAAARATLDLLAA